MNLNPIKKINEEKVYALVRQTDPQKAIEITQALIDGGIKTIEIVIENQSLNEAIIHFSSVKDVTIAAGGIITARQAQLALEANAKILVSPVFQMGLVKFCQSYETPLIMTATTPNEAYCAWKTRIPLIKIYPTKAMGGVEYIEEILRPMPFLNLIATGNIGLDNCTDYIKAGAIAVGIGRAFYNNASVAEITQRAKKVVNDMKQFL